MTIRSRGRVKFMTAGAVINLDSTLYGGRIFYTGGECCFLIYNAMSIRLRGIIIKEYRLEKQGIYT